jgi:hypothetical protein
MIQSVAAGKHRDWDSAYFAAALAVTEEDLARLEKAQSARPIARAGGGSAAAVRDTGMDAHISAALEKHYAA